MISAFGVEHGEISKAAEDGKRIKAGKNDLMIRSRGERKAYRRGMAGPYAASLGLFGGSIYGATSGKPGIAAGLGAASAAAAMSSSVAGHKAANKWRQKHKLKARNYWTGLPQGD